MSTGKPATLDSLPPQEGPSHCDASSAEELRKVIAKIEGRVPLAGGGHKPGKESRAGEEAQELQQGIDPHHPVAHHVMHRVALGIDCIDAVFDPPSHASPHSHASLPGGIIANGLHEVRAETGLAAGAGAGFALALGLTLARGVAKGMIRQRGTDGHELPSLSPLPPVFWIADRHTRQEYGGFYSPGLAAFGLSPENLIRIHPQSREESLWAAGEIAATPGAAAFCLIEIRRHPKEMDLTTTRRLLLRAQVSGTPVILLRQSGEEEASAALTRWHVRPAASQTCPDPTVPHRLLPLPDQFIGPPSFDVQLEKCRGGNANSSTRWIMEWNRDDQCLALASRTALPQTHSALANRRAAIAGSAREIRTLQPGSDRGTNWGKDRQQAG